MVKKKKVRTYCERLYCDECGTEMEKKDDADPLFLLSMDKQYKYGCPKCKAEQSSYTLYPRMIYHEGELV